MDNFYGYGEPVKPKRKPLVIAAVVLGVLAVVAVVAVVVLAVSKNSSQPEKTTYTLAEVQAAANRYANFLVKGKEDDASDVAEVSYVGETALAQTLSEDTDEERRTDFVKTAKKLNKDLRKKLKNVEEGKIAEADDYASMVEDVGVEVSMVNKFVDTDFEIKNYLKVYQKNKEDGVGKAVVKDYEDVLLYYTLVHVANENPKDGDEYIEYSEIATDTEKILADFYRSLIDYGETVNNTLTFYEEKDCLGTQVIRTTCREIADETDVGKIYIEEREVSLKSMIEKIDEAKRDVVVVAQDIAQKIAK